MALTLNYSYQIISKIGTKYGEIRTYAKVNSQDKNLNKSYFNLKMTYYLRSWIETSSANANLDGSTRGYGYTRFNAGETTILEVSREIGHNEDGSSPIKNVYSSFSASFGGGGSTSADIVMPKIDRLATVIRANDFTDEENPTMEFSNPIGFKVHPYLYFYKRGDYSKEVFGLTREIDNAPTPYNWAITEEEREQIRNALNEATEYDVAIGLFTYNFENTYLGQTNIVRKFTIVDCEPLIELTCNEKNEKVKAITNNEYILVNNVSVLNVEANLTLKKGANASKVLIQDVEVPSPYSTDLNIIGQEETYVVNGKVIDSRQLENSNSSPPYQLIDYRPVKIDSFNFKRENPTSSQIILNVEITYWQVNVNSVDNVPVVYYSTDGELFNEIPSENYSIDEENHKLRITNYNVPTQLDYREQGTYYLKIEDKFTIDNENQVITKGIPTVEAGENDFQVNGDLFIADENRENKINVKKIINNIWNLVYPIGSYYETSDTEFNPNTTWGGTWDLENDGTVLASKSNTPNSKFNNDIGSIVGEETVRLTHDTMPRHAHNENALSGYGYPNNLVGNDANILDSNITTYTTGGYVPTTSWTAKTGNQNQTMLTGGGQAHNNIQPTKIVNRWHRVE